MHFVHLDIPLPFRGIYAILLKLIQTFFVQKQSTIQSLKPSIYLSA